MLEEIWGNRIVEDGNLTVHISALRKALRGEHDEEDLIATLPRKGYSFVGLVEETVDRSADVPDDPSRPVGDFGGDAREDISVFRPSSGVWYRLNSANGSFFAAQFGAAGDRPTPAAFRY